MYYSVWSSSESEACAFFSVVDVEAYIVWRWLNGHTVCVIESHCPVDVKRMEKRTTNLTANGDNASWSSSGGDGKCIFSVSVLLEGRRACAESFFIFLPSTILPAIADYCCSLQTFISIFTCVCWTAPTARHFEYREYRAHCLLSVDMGLSCERKRQQTTKSSFNCMLSGSAAAASSPVLLSVISSEKYCANCNHLAIHVVRFVWRELLTCLCISTLRPYDIS